MCLSGSVLMYEDMKRYAMASKGLLGPCRARRGGPTSPYSQGTISKTLRWLSFGTSVPRQGSQKQSWTLVGRPSAAASTFVDVFSGTGAVSRAAALRGWRILANDYLYSSSVMTKAQLLSPEDVLFRSFGGYQTCMRHLQSSTLPKWNTHFLFIL